MSDSFFSSIFDSRNLFQYCIGPYLSLNDMVSLGQVDHSFHARVKRFFPQVALGNMINRLYPERPVYLDDDSCFGWIKEVIAHGKTNETKLFFFHWIAESVTKFNVRISGFAPESLQKRFFKFAILENARNGNMSFHTLLLSSLCAKESFQDCERLLAKYTLSAAMTAVLAKRFDFANTLLTTICAETQGEFLCRKLTFENLLNHAVAWRLESILNQLERIHSTTSVCDISVCLYCKLYSFRIRGLSGPIVDLCNVPDHDYIDRFWRNTRGGRDSALRGTLENCVKAGYHYQAVQLEAFLQVPFSAFDWSCMYDKCKKRMRKRHAKLCTDLGERIDPEEYNAHVETLKWVKRRRDHAKEKDEERQRQRADDDVKEQVLEIFKNKRARFD